MICVAISFRMQSISAVQVTLDMLHSVTAISMPLQIQSVIRVTRWQGGESISLA
jgi:hypothetical protein